MQLSRPYMFVLGAVVVLAAAWLLVLHPHGQSGTASSPAAPGVTGLAHDVAKARGAVALSGHNAAALAEKSAAASTSKSSAAAGGTAAPAATSSAPHASRPGTFPAVKGPSPAARPQRSHAAPVSDSARVTQALTQHKVVVLLVWDPRGADDQAVLHQLHGISRADRGVVVLTAQPSEVASFGAVTKNVQIFETPTTLIIDPHGQATAITGLTDATAIEQAISDARRGGAGQAQAPTFTAWQPHTSRSAYIGRANGLCTTQVTRSGSSSAVVTRLRALPAPAADRAALDRYYASVQRAISESGAKAATDFDYGAQGLADYGLSGCFAPESRTS